EPDYRHLGGGSRRCDEMSFLLHRSVQADLPHTALRSMVLPRRGLAGQGMSRLQTEKPLLGEERVGPADVGRAVAVFPTTGASAQQASQPAADHPIDATENPAMTVLEV